MPAIATQLKLSQYPLIRMRLVQPPATHERPTLRLVEPLVGQAITAPDEFVQGLCQIEQSFGTARATVVGLAASLGLDAADVMATLERTEELLSQVRQELGGEVEPQALFSLLAPKLIYYDGGRCTPKTLDYLDFSKAMAVLEKNLAGESLPIGDCTLCTAVFLVFALSFGWGAGLARVLHDVHVFGYIEAGQGKYLFNRLEKIPRTRDQLGQAFGSEKVWRQFYAELMRPGDFYFKANLSREYLQAQPNSDILLNEKERVFRAIELRNFDEARAQGRLMRLSSFAVIGELLSLRAGDVFDFSYKSLSQDEKAQLLSSLKLAERINPFAFLLCLRVAKAINGEQGLSLSDGRSNEEAKTYAQQQRRIDNLEIGNDGLPVLAD